ncbi:PadR family transcriptional regulator [Paenibacillus sabuli]|nr:PadR family transcriptional regulator [Paenibacillus sabuli]
MKALQPHERLFLHHKGLDAVSGEGRRFFGRGRLKPALLELLRIEPMHGYQMIKALEARFEGLYAPSPGSVYPQLQQLEDDGYVQAEERGGRKVYTMTEAGEAHLAAERERRGIERDAAGKDGTDESPGMDAARCGTVGCASGEVAQHSEAGERGVESGASNPAEVPATETQRPRRLTPAGRELLLLLKAAERAALEEPAKAQQLRRVLGGLRVELQTLIGPGEAELQAGAGPHALNELPAAAPEQAQRAAPGRSREEE